MSVIDEQTAWDILYRYVDDCANIDAPSLLAAYAVGSLPAGYYRPGQSDIDALLLVQDGAEALWGTCMVPCRRLESLNRQYRDTYRIPKDFGPFPISASELFPPYDPKKELVPEIARLKIQGRCVYGSFNVDTIPMPKPADFLAHARHFEEWWRVEFSLSKAAEELPPEACVNTILLHLRRFLWIERNVIQFDKRKTLAQYLDKEPPFIYPAAFALVERTLDGQTVSDREAETLRSTALILRKEMNDYLGISA